MDEQRRLIKNTGIIALGNMSTKLVSFFLLPLYTSILSTAEYGTVDYVISISTFCVPFISMLMDESMFRFLIDCKNGAGEKSGDFHIDGHHFDRRDSLWRGRLSRIENCALSIRFFSDCLCYLIGCQRYDECVVKGNWQNRAVRDL